MRKIFFNKLSLLITLLGVTTLLVLSMSGVKKPQTITRFDKSIPSIIDYNLHVKPILSDKCFLCHGPDKNNGQKAGLNLSMSEGSRAVLKDGKRAIVPGNLARSELYNRIITNDEEMAMPTPASNRHLTDYEKAILTRWIEQGAEYKPHWAFTEPLKNPIPPVKDRSWPINAIDYFVLQNLEAKGLTPSPAADKETILRRVYFDLTGLPPTIEQTDSFLADSSTNAYEKLVDRLLNSKQYGEKLAVDWLDLSRYADTHGYTVDRYRIMWPWRDWVIKAFNENMPFDRFVTWQLAGDLLPNPTKEQIIATAFNRNHAQNMEGGIINEEFRNEYVVDRTSTFGTAFLGLTIGCARCHDHKFDPISQKDFYSLYSFFNNIDEAGQISFDNATPGPSVLLTNSQQDSILAYLKEKEAAQLKELSQLEITEKTEYEKWKQNTGSTVQVDIKKGLQAWFSFDQIGTDGFINRMGKTGKTEIADPVLVPGKFGNAFKSNGDDILKLGKVGVFDRFEPFSIGLWINIPKELNKGVIVHKGNGDITYGFHGYYLNLREGRLEFLMAHTWPYNNFLSVSAATLPKEKWLQLTLTYDGSGKAGGVKIFMDGLPMAMNIEKDNLYKSILFEGKDQPGLQVGADWRGTGFKDGLVDELFVYNRELNPAEITLLMKGFPQKEKQELKMNEGDLKSFYYRSVSSTWQKKSGDLHALRLEIGRQVEPIPEMMVMEEMPKPRPAHVLLRGAYDAPGPAVVPDVPAAVLPYPGHLRRDRLGLAQWLLDPKNPLTARVAVNRYWQIYFGNGLQKNPDNFGNQGGVPSNLNLLDWLAVHFRESGWNIKELQKMIVLSATYKQSSFATEDQLKKDPDNALLSRGPSFRLTAEMIRDAALKAGGLLSPVIGGPSVKPYQPVGVWSVNGEEYRQDSGSGLYRRSMYTFWRRTNPPPSMSTFDAPMRASCVIKRQKTGTPLQALVLLNDPQFTEAARVLFVRAASLYSEPRQQVQYCYRTLTGRKPSAKEVGILYQLFERQSEIFKAAPEKMQGWLQSGENRLGANLPAATLAAGTVMASTIMNSDAFITRR